MLILAGVPNRLADAVSPYLRSHADNPVDWREWGADAFAEAAERDVPVLVSIGYSTCHWCHVMARESFSDPVLAAHLDERFVAIKVDREEYPEVDAAYLAAAQAFTPNLGWPLNVFVTPTGRAFFAGTYFPPEPMQGHPSFRTVLDAVTEAWRHRRAEVESNGDAIAAALAAPAAQSSGSLPSGEAFDRLVGELAGYEDSEFGGFGSAPKFPVAPVVSLLLDRGSLGNPDAAALAARTLDAMAASDLRDEVEGGFFRYSTMRDWSDPHYERMLYDNALLLGTYSRVPGGVPVADGIARFLAATMRLPGGAFASAQDSESTVDGKRVEGRYYALDAAGRASQHPPALDEKVLTGWNGLAIDSLASAGSRLGRPQWIRLARDAADYLLARHVLDDGTLVRASIGARMSAARATLEDYGMFAAGLLTVSLTTGEVRYAVAARSLVDATLHDGAFAVPGGGDPVLSAQGLALETDPSEGAYPSGISAIAGAAHTLYLLTAERRYLDAASAAMAALTDLALPRPISFGAALSVMSRLMSPVAQLVVVVPDAASGGVASAGLSGGVASADLGSGEVRSADVESADVASGDVAADAGSAGVAPADLASANMSSTDVASSELGSADVASAEPASAVVVPDTASGGAASADVVSTDVAPAGAGLVGAASDELVLPSGALADLARTWDRAGAVVSVVTESQARAFARAGFELFEARTPVGDDSAAYLCRDFVCRLPMTSADELGRALRETTRA